MYPQKYGHKTLVYTLHSVHMQKFHQKDTGFSEIRSVAVNKSLVP